MNKSYNMNIDTGEKTWLTPPHIINALGPFDLDPCCPPTMPWRTATRMVHWPEDGLQVDWTGKRVWCNPPYGHDAVPFLRKMAENKIGGGGYFAIFRPYGFFHVARPHLSKRLRYFVPSRAYQVLSPRRNASKHGLRALCARRVLRTGLCPSPRERPQRGVFARLMLTN